MESTKKQLRSADTWTLHLYCPGEVSSLQVPTGKEVVSRMMFLTSRGLGDKGHFSIDNAALSVAMELQYLFICNLNIYPVVEKNIKKKIINAYQEFKKLANYPKSKQSGQSYQSAVLEFNKKLERGYAIRTEDENRQKELAKYHGVKCGPQEE